MPDVVKTRNLLDFPFTGQILAQSQPAGTGAVSLFSINGTSQRGATAYNLFIANVTGSSVVYSVYFTNGTTYNSTTALYYQQTLAANQTDDIVFVNGLSFLAATTNLAVQSGTGSAITYTLTGLLKGF